jgi:hypothetical protein
MKLILEQLSFDVINTLKNMELPINPVIVYNIDNTLIYSDGTPNIHILKILNFSKSLNIDSIFITSRSSNEETISYTKEQLKKYQINYKLIYFNKGYKEVSEYKKNCRRDLVKKGYNIIMCIGSNYSDIYGEYTNYPVKVPNKNEIELNKNTLEIINEEDEDEEEEEEKI